MIQLRHIIMLFASLTLFAACSDDKLPAETETVSEITTSLTTVNSKISAAADLMGGTSTTADNFLRWENSDYVSRAAFGGAWTAGTAINNLYNGGQYSLQQWFIDEFDENFQNSNGAKITFGGRLKNALDIMCYLPAMGVPTDSTNLPTPGTHAGTITPAIALKCGGETTTESRSVTISSAATTNTTLYDRFLSINLGNNCPFKVYARMNSTAINVATAEDQFCDGRDHASRSVVHHDKSTDKTRFYYVSKAFNFDDPTGFEVYKGYVDSTADNAYIVGFYGGDDDGDSTFESGVSFTAAGKPTAGGTVAVSAMTNFANNPAAGKGVFEACVTPSTMAIPNDGTLTCTLTGFDSATAHTNVVIDDYDNKGYTTRADIYNIGETTTVDFTDNTDIFLNN